MAFPPEHKSRRSNKTMSSINIEGISSIHTWRLFMQVVPRRGLFMYIFFYDMLGLGKPLLVSYSNQRHSPCKRGTGKASIAQFVEQTFSPHADLGDNRKVQGPNSTNGKARRDFQELIRWQEMRCQGFWQREYSVFLNFPQEIRTLFPEPFNWWYWNLKDVGWNEAIILFTWGDSNRWC